MDVLDRITDWIQSVHPAWWLLLLGVGVLLAALSGSKAPVIKTRDGGKSPGGRRVLWRFVSGAHLDGQTRTDAGWWSRGRHDLTTAKKAPRWAYLPRGVRSLIRWAVLTVLVLFLLGYLLGSTTALVLAWITVGAVALTVAALAPRRISRIRHYRRHVLPVHKALRKLVGHEEDTQPGDWISIPRHYSRSGAVIRLDLPGAFPDTPQLRQGINNAVTNNLGLRLHELEIAYEVTAQHPHVKFTSVDAADRYLRAVDNETTNTTDSTNNRDAM